MNIFLFKLINNARLPILDWISTIISSYWFLITLVFGILLFVILSPLVLHKTRTIVMIILACVLNLIIVNIISKNLLITPRPYMVLENTHILGVKQLDSAIPSSHVSMMTSVLFALVINNPMLWPVLFFILLLGWSRIYNGMHWPGDVLLGMVVGVVCVLIISLIFKPFHFPGVLERK